MEYLPLVLREAGRFLRHSGLLRQTEEREKLATVAAAYPALSSSVLAENRLGFVSSSTLPICEFYSFCEPKTLAAGFNFATLCRCTNGR